MYPYKLMIVADGLRFTSRHKTYGEAVAFQLELEAKLGNLACIRLCVEEQSVSVHW